MEITLKATAKVIQAAGYISSRGLNILLSTKTTEYCKDFSMKRFLNDPAFFGQSIAIVTLSKKEIWIDQIDKNGVRHRRDKISAISFSKLVRGCCPLAKRFINELVPGLVPDGVDKFVPLPADRSPKANVYGQSRRLV